MGERSGRRAGQEELDQVLERNIEALLARRRAQETRQGWQEKLAEALGRFAGSMAFVWIHAVIVLLWVGVNAGFLPGPRFDEDFVKLATAASVEAIFLSTFVLVTQNRMAALADKRSDLDVQISLLSEHEVTRLIRLVSAMARRMGIEEGKEPALEALSRDVEPEEVLDRLETAERRHGEDPDVAV